MATSQLVDVDELTIVKMLAAGRSNGERYGVWGGLSERERRRLLGEVS